MKPCKQCDKNDWSYVKLDDDPHIYCKCNKCGYKFSFLIPKKKCMFCRQRADFEHIDIDENTRGKKCSLCGKIKRLKIAKAVFIRGVLQKD